VTLGILLAAPLRAELTNDDTLLLDDFRDSSGLSQIGVYWQGFSDRVMGGVSTMQAGIARNESGEGILRMTGEVSLANNGGFIQVRLPLTIDRLPLDAGVYGGVRLRVRGTGDGYYIHLRTDTSRAPWIYYSQPLPVTEEWRTVELRFDGFRGESTSRPLDTSRLVSLAVVAAKREFSAFIEIDALSLVP
jgi:hypothetical protein